MKKKNLFWVVGLLAAWLLLTGCGGDTAGGTVSQPDTPPAHSQQQQETPPVQNQQQQENLPVQNEQAPQQPDEEENVIKQDPQPDKEPAEKEEVVLPSAGSTFAVHFLDVGQGDCALVLCDGKAMLIDGGESDQSSKVYAYLKDKGIQYLDYMVATHGHSDHIGGLSGALNYAKVGTALCPVTEYDSKTFRNLVKYLGQQGVEITVPAPGDSFMLGSARVQVLGPQKNYDEPNDTSIVLKVTYGQTSFLFTGDAERTAETDILARGYDLSATVLKVGHHGSDSSTSYPFLREIMPEYAVIQVGEGNSYGHPTENTLSRLRDADVKVYRNDLQGDIICTSDGTQVFFSVEQNENVQTNPTQSEAVVEDVGEYIGNRNSHKFHVPTCKNLPAEKNRVYFASRQQAVDGGYDPCGNCKP